MIEDNPDGAPEGFVMLEFGAEALRGRGLEVVPYPIPLGLLEIMVEQADGDPAPFLLAGLQALTARGDSAWRELEPAMRCLAEVLAEEDSHDEVSAAGEDWWIMLGGIDLSSPLITIERAGELIAGIQKGDDGRLRAAAFRPLDGKSASMLISLSRTPHPAHGVVMRETNWDYALDSAAANGNTYAALRGEAYLSFHPGGLAAVPLSQSPPSQVALELGVCFAFSEHT